MSFVDGVEKAAVAEKQRADQREARHREWEEQARAAEYERQLIRAQCERVEALLADVSAWRQAADLPAYVDATGRRDEWAKWALAVADDIDPTGSQSKGPERG